MSKPTSIRLIPEFSTASTTVSVVVPTYNQAQYLEETLEGILNQSVKPLQVIVVDDGSTDNTPRLLRRFESVITTIRVPNGGVASARNTGLSRARARFVAFCDSDDVWHPEKLESQLNRLLERPECQWCLCGTLFVDERGQPIGEASSGTEGWVYDKIVRLQPGVLFGGGSAVIVATELARGIGGFNEGLTTSADWDFFARLAVNSPLSFVPRPLVKYRVRSSGMHMNLDTWERDMTAAIAGLRARGLMPAATQARALAELDAQIAGEYWRRGLRSAAIRRLGRRSLKNPQLVSRALQRLAARATRHSRKQAAGD